MRRSVSHPTGAKPPAVHLRSDDARTIDAFRRVLEAGEYTEQAIAAALGEAAHAPQGWPDPAIQQRRLPRGSRLSTLIELFFLGRPVRLREARRALAPASLPRLAALGLLSPRGDRVRARVRLVPCEDLIVAGDRPPADPAHPPARYVAALSAPARLLAALTVRRRIADALDLGTGSGVQALLAARHSRRVIATDVNPRALAYAAFNARLNALPHVQCRAGSLFEPVASEQFDLIVSNPPYVISPESAFLFRDSGQRGDALCRALIGAASGFLREGGWAVVLVNWIADREGAWWEPLRSWVEGPGFDAWLLHDRTFHPLDYAAVWNQWLRLSEPRAYGSTLDRWLGYYRRLGIEAIASGAILLRRRAQGPNWVRADDLPARVTRSASRQLLRTAATQDYLATLQDVRVLRGARLRPAAGYRVTTTRRGPDARAGEDPATVTLDDALPFAVRVEARVLEVLARCDGRRRLGEILAAVVGPGSRVDASRVLRGVRELVRAGIL
ncbi:MAG TPA: methyltransferase, partial [Methylomirabilota bacterium]